MAGKEENDTENRKTGAKLKTKNRRVTAPLRRATDY